MPCKNELNMKSTKLVYQLLGGEPQWLCFIQWTGLQWSLMTKRADVGLKDNTELGIKENRWQGKVAVSGGSFVRIMFSWSDGRPKRVLKLQREAYGHFRSRKLTALTNLLVSRQRWYKFTTGLKQRCWEPMIRYQSDTWRLIIFFWWLRFGKIQIQIK